MHFYFRLLLACLVLLSLSGNSLAKKANKAKAGPYGIVPTKKASNNRSCRATWYVAENMILLADIPGLDQPALTLVPPSVVLQDLR